MCTAPQVLRHLCDQLAKVLLKAPRLAESVRTSAPAGGGVGADHDAAGQRRRAVASAVKQALHWEEAEDAEAKAPQVSAWLLRTVVVACMHLVSRSLRVALGFQQSLFGGRSLAGFGKQTLQTVQHSLHQKYFVSWKLFQTVECGT